MSTSKTLSFNHLALSVLLSSLLIVLSYQHRLDFLITPVNSLFNPLRLPLVYLRSNLHRQTEFFRTLPHQYRLIEDYKRQNAALSVTAKMAKDLETENTALRAQVNTPLSPNLRLLPAKVIGITRTAVVNQGEKSGVKPGQAVIREKVILGTVVSVTPNTAKIRLIENADTTLPAVTLNSASGSVISENGQLKFTEVLQKDTLSIDDPLFTKGSESVPEGLLIGNIRSVDSNPSQVYQSASVAPALSVGDQDVVFIIVN